MSTIELNVYEILKSKFGEKEAKEVLEFIDNKTEEKINNKKDVFMTKDDKVEIMRTIYFVGLVQFVAIVGSVIAIVMFAIK